MPDHSPSNDPNPTQPLPPTPAPPANVTPFDTQLVDDPNAPRYTQPLPSQFAQSPNASPPTYAPHSLPRQVVPDTNTNAAATSSTRSVTGVAPSVATPVSTNAPITPTSSLPASRLPLGTIAGLAAIGGALAVVLGSAWFRSLAPVPESARGNSTIVVEKPAPTNTIIMQRPEETTTEVVAPDATPRTNNTTSTESVAPPQAIVAPDENAAPRDENTASRDIEYSSSRDNDAQRNANRDDDTQRNDAPSNESTNGDAANDASSGSNSSSENALSANASSRFVERRRAYSIRPPREFRLTRKGRRTIWKSRNGAQLLVEVGKNDGETPRAGWEKLDRALQKKYGSRYQSRGIRDTTLNGRQAAIWEFDLKQKDGSVVRKMDVAVVDKNNGYAVLASAPVEKFEAMRPTWDRVLESFQIESTTDNSSDNSNDTTSNDDIPQGY